MKKTIAELIKQIDKVLEETPIQAGALVKAKKNKFRSVKTQIKDKELMKTKTKSRKC